jgi:hypothetical protein
MAMRAATLGLDCWLASMDGNQSIPTEEQGGTVCSVVSCALIINLINFLQTTEKWKLSLAGKPAQGNV